MFANKKKYLSLLWGLPIVIVSAIGQSPRYAIATPTGINHVLAQTPRSGGGAMTVRSDIQEANSQTGVITARGNVQINYPARKIQATSAQAQYFSRERRLVLSGNVYVLQEGNSMRAETMTYLVDEGRFIATPQANQQVESIYIVSDPESANTNPVSVPPAPSLNRQP
jgi:lipopolysaccharide export system protein LptA